MPRLATLIAAVGGAASLAAAAPAQAASPAPFTISESVTDNTFTATGPICASGTFSDDLSVAPASEHNNAIDHRGGFNVVIHTVYTCADGTGSIYALKVQRITFTDSGLTGTGEIQLHGGTGAYTALEGHGTDIGSINFDTGEGLGQISGFITQP
jgi:hypothetical protein